MRGLQSLSSFCHSLSDGHLLVILIPCAISDDPVEMFVSRGSKVTSLESILNKPLSPLPDPGRTQLPSSPGLNNDLSPWEHLKRARLERVLQVAVGQGAAKTESLVSCRTQNAMGQCHPSDSDSSSSHHRPKPMNCVEVIICGRRGRDL